VIFNDHFVANLQIESARERIWKSIKILKGCCYKLGVFLFWTV